MSMTRICRSDRAAYRRMEEQGAVLLHLDSGAYHQVNDVGALIWDLLEDEPSREELLAAVRERIDDAPEEIDEDVDEFIAALQERQLIVVDDSGGSATSA